MNVNSVNTGSALSDPWRGAVDDAECLTEGRRAYESHDWAAAVAAFSQVAASPDHAAAGWYGLGMVALQTHDGRAEECFERALEQDPRHANSLYQLGLLSEAASPDASRRFYAAALASAPGHRGAQARLRALGDSPPDNNWASPSPQPGQAPGVNPHQGLGVYDFLRQDNSALSRQAADLVDVLRLSCRPSLSAYVGQMLWSGLILAVFVDAAAYARGSGFSHAAAGAVQIGAFLVNGLRLHVRVRARRVTIENARIAVERGVLRKRLTTYDIWRITDIGVRRSLINRVTGDGTLVLSMSGGKKLKLVGIARRDLLDKLRQDLQDLAFTLRANSVMKGIIQ